MHRRLATISTTLAIVGAFFLSGAPVRAAFGDVLAQFDASTTAGVPACSVGTGIAFDGNSLLLSCWRSNVLHKVDPVTHSSDGTLTLPGISDVGAMAYDGGRNGLWVCSNGSSVRLFDATTGAIDTSVTPFNVAGCLDGLAYDGEDDTIWTSPDAHGTTYQYALDGSPLGADPNGMCNSGIAVGGERLYLADNCANKLWQVDKDFGSQTLLSTFTRRMEDLECDELTFAPKAAIWAQDAYDRILTAYEIPAGSCDHGGSAASCELIGVAITRPLVGHQYDNDIDVGLVGGTNAVVSGSPLTIEATTTSVPNTASVEFMVDGVSVGIDTTSPYQAIVPGSLALGSHILKARVTHATDPTCRSSATVGINVECTYIALSIDRPTSGRVYDQDIDIGARPGSATVLNGDLTATAGTTRPDLLAGIDFELLGIGPVVTDPVAPYSGTLDLSAAPPGTTQMLEVRARYLDPACTVSRQIPIVIADPDAAAVSKAVHITKNVPVEPVITAGGTSAHDGTDSYVMRDVPATGPLDRLTVIDDRASASSEPVMAEASSKLEHVSLAGGAVTIDTLYTRSRVSHGSGLTTNASFAGSYLANVVINGTQVLIDEPNTKIQVPGLGHVTFLETLESSDYGQRALTVNAVHAFIDTPFKAEVILGSSHSALNLYEPNLIGPANDLIHELDDAGTNSDAPGAPSMGLPIEQGVHTGLLQDEDRVDAFTFDAGQGDRIIATVRASERLNVPVPASAGLVETDVILELYDPAGDLRESSALGSHLPQRVELNADKPYFPEGEKGRWALVVRNASNFDTFYTLTLSVPPNPLLEQEDANIPGDAGNTCGNARGLPAALQPNELDHKGFTGVIRDIDPADYFSFDATQGQLVSVVLKPDVLVDGADLDLDIRGPATPGGVTNCSATPLFSSRLGKKPLPKASPDVVALLPVERTGRYTIGVIRFNAVANYVVDISVTNPNPTQPGNDARTGADASSNCATATVVEMGTYQGRVIDEPSDPADWFKFEVPEGADVTVTVVPSPGSAMNAQVLGGCTTSPLISTAPRLTPAQPWEFRRTNIAAQTLQLGISLGASGGGNYQFTITITP